MSSQQITATARSAEFRRHLTQLLVELCEIDTSPRTDVGALRRAEAAAFDVIERDVHTCGLPAPRLVRVPIDPGIAAHPAYTKPFYTQTADRPAGLDAAQCYAGRANLLLLLDGTLAEDRGVHQALNAHVDVIAPYFAPRLQGEVVHGRGTSDDKGGLVALLGVLRLLGVHVRAGGRPLNRHLTCMFVIDEETGGNGSLSCAIDRTLKERYESMLVLECADGRVYPGNRGCVWYKITGRCPDANLFEAAMFVIEALEQLGQTLRAESDHPLFPHRPVQTCHGVIGNSGEHPSRINGDVTFDILLAEPARRAALWDRVWEALEAGLKTYTAAYGDKTKVMSADTGRPCIDHHYDLRQTAAGFTVRVWGSSGHMGAIAKHDGAITKMAALVRALVARRAVIERVAGSHVRLGLHGWPDSAHLLMEGGQGFLPTHALEQVQARMRAAIVRGVQNYVQASGTGVDVARCLSVSFERLHNAAFAGDPDGPDMRNAIAAAQAAGTWKGDPIWGWDVSCDARLFACEYPGLPVLTTGPGALHLAHSDREQINIADVARAAEFLALFVLRQTGTA